MNVSEHTIFQNSSKTHLKTAANSTNQI